MTSFVTAFFGSGFDVPSEKDHRSKTHFACAATSLHIETRMRNGSPAAGLLLSLDKVIGQNRTRTTLSLKQAFKHSKPARNTTIISAVYRITIRKAFRAAAKSSLPAQFISSPQSSQITMPAPFWFDQMSQNKREDNEEDYDERVELARSKPDQHFRWCRRELQELIHCTPGKWNVILPPDRNKTGRVASEDRYKDNVKMEKRRYEHFANYEKDPKTLLKEATYRSMRYRQTEMKTDAKKLVERKKGWKVSLPKALKEQLSKPIQAIAEEHASHAPASGSQNPSSDHIQSISNEEGDAPGDQNAQTNSSGWATDDNEELGDDAEGEAWVPDGKGTNMPWPDAIAHPDHDYTNIHILLPPTRKSETPATAKPVRRPICQHLYCKMVQGRHDSKCVAHVLALASCSHTTTATTPLRRHSFGQRSEVLVRSEGRVDEDFISTYFLLPPVHGPSSALPRSPIRTSKCEHLSCAMLNGKHDKCCVHHIMRFASLKLRPEDSLVPRRRQSL